MAETAQRHLPAALIDVPAHVSAHVSAHLLAAASAAAPRSASEAASASESPWLRVVPPATRFILQGRGGARTAASAAWGVEFSDDACRAIVTGDRATLWLGPDEYLLLDADVADADAGAAALAHALTGIPHSLVDVSHRQIALQLRGPHAATILNGACPLDLDLAGFPVGMCTRTVFAKADIVLWRTASDTFHVEVWRSFAAYVTGLLYEIAREFEGEA
jgi:sarcosine oxidase subunit gamma